MEALVCWHAQFITLPYMGYMTVPFGMGTDISTDTLYPKKYAAKVLECQRFGLSTIWFVDVLICRHFWLSTFLTCRMCRAVFPVYKDKTSVIFSNLYKRTLCASGLAYLYCDGATIVVEIQIDYTTSKSECYVSKTTRIKKVLQQTMYFHSLGWNSLESD